MTAVGVGLGMDAVDSSIASDNSLRIPSWAISARYFPGPPFHLPLFRVYFLGPFRKSLRQLRRIRSRASFFTLILQQILLSAVSVWRTCFAAYEAWWDTYLIRRSRRPCSSMKLRKPGPQSVRKLALVFGIKGVNIQGICSSFVGNLPGSSVHFSVWKYAPTLNKGHQWEDKISVSPLESHCLSIQFWKLTWILGNNSISMDCDSSH